MCLHGTFRGKDCRIMRKMHECLSAMAARDGKAMNPKPTAAISTRELMIHDEDTQIMDDDFAGVMEWVEQCVDHGVPF